MKEISLFTLKEKFPELIDEIQGDSGILVNHCSSAETSEAKSLCFASDEKQFKMATSGAAQAFVLPTKFKGKVDVKSAGFIFVKNHSLAHAKFAEFLDGRYPAHEVAPAIHATALISKSAVLGKNIKVGPHVVIGDNVRIGDDVFVGANCVIENSSVIGKHSHLWPMVFVGAECVIGDECQIHPNATIGSEGYGFAHDEKGNHHRIPQIGNVVLGNRVEIGANCTIDRGTFGSTVIGDGTKLDNIIHIAHNVQIGKNCLLTSGFKIGGSSTVGDNVMGGGSVTIRDHVNICSNVRFAGWSGVNNDVTEPGDYGGHPLQNVRDYLKTTMCLPHLPEFRKRLAEIETLLGKKSE